MWSLLGLAACFADRPDEADRLLDRARAVIPADDGYTRCLVAATAAMSDQLADRPATVRAAVEPVWALAMDLGSEFWFAWAQALLGWAVAAEDAPAGLAMMTETVDASGVRQTKPYFLYLLGLAAVRGRSLARGHGPPRRGPGPAAETDERLWEPLLRLTRARWLAVAGDSDAASAARPTRATTGQYLCRHDAGRTSSSRWHDESEARIGGSHRSEVGRPVDGRRARPSGAPSATSRPTAPSPPTSPPSVPAAPAR